MRRSLTHFVLPSTIIASILYTQRHYFTNRPVTSLAILASTAALVMIAWRVSSRHHSIPCPSWMSGAVEMDNPFAKKVHGAKNIIKHASINPGDSVLDAGSGPGRVTIPAAESVGPGGSIWAMDIQSDMLKKVEKKARERGIKNIHYLHAGLGENKLPLSKFDKALLVATLGEIPNQELALKELYNATKPDGIVSVTELIFDPHFQTRKSLIRVAEKAGFHERDRFGSWFAYTINLAKNESPHSVETVSMLNPKS